MFRIDGAVLQDQHLKSFFHCIHRIAAEAINGFAQRAGLPIGTEITLQCFGLEDAGVYASDLFQLVVAQYRIFQRYGMAGEWLFIKKITIIANESCQRHHQSFPNGIDGWIGDLRKQLFEVIA